MLVVPGRPSARALLWWVLNDTVMAPTLTLSGPGANPNALVSRQLGTPDDPLVARQVYVVAAIDLQPDTTYTLVATSGNARAQATSRTFPEALAPDQPFTIAVGSCFSLAQDHGLEAFYPPAPHRAGSADPIRLRVLCGDQLYMDLSPASGSPLSFHPPAPWQRYREQWSHPAYAAFLRQSPTLVMADDHEYWNDYPHGDAWLLWAESDPNGPLGGAMDRAFEVFQAALNLDPVTVHTAAPGELDMLLRHTARTFEVHVEPLHFFCLDTRTQRTRYDAPQPHFTLATWLSDAITWLQEASGARVLFLSQPAIEQRVSAFARATHLFGDANLPEYDGDFAALWEALCSAPTDRLVVSGDIHWSRLYQAQRPTHASTQVYEAIASPLARISGGAPGVGEASGKVAWDRPGGRADWLKCYATDVEAMYTTLTFRPRSVGDRSDVTVQATVWGMPPSRIQGAVPLCQHTFTLRGAVA